MKLVSNIIIYIYISLNFQKSLDHTQLSTKDLMEKYKRAALVDGLIKEKARINLVSVCELDRLQHHQARLVIPESLK